MHLMTLYNWHARTTRLHWSVYKIDWNSRTYLKSQQNQRTILSGAGYANPSPYLKRSQKVTQGRKNSHWLKSVVKLLTKTRYTAHLFLLCNEGPMTQAIVLPGDRGKKRSKTSAFIPKDKVASWPWAGRFRSLQPSGHSHPSLYYS